MKKILFIAYKIEKDKGSEDGTGYNVARLLAKENISLTVITRQNNIDKLQNDTEFSNVRFLAGDVPKALSFYKNKHRGIILYYYLWQICVGLKIHKLQKTETFDVIHQFNFHATWAPHFIFSKSRIIWGPLTHHANIPFSFWHGNKYLYPLEIVRRLVKRFFFNIDPFLKWALRRTDLFILGYNDFIGCYQSHKTKSLIMPQARSIFPVVQEKTVSDDFNILFVGRFISLKGCMTALLAIEKTLSHVSNGRISFTMIGEGNLLPLLKKITDRIATTSTVKINIIDWVDQPSLTSHYAKANLFLFPSFEGQGLVVAEALAHGCPVLCLEKTGPAAIAAQAGITVSKDDFKKTISVLSLQLEHLVNEYWDRPESYKKRIALALERAQDLSWEKKTASLMECYNG